MGKHINQNQKKYSKQKYIKKANKEKIQDERVIIPNQIMQNSYKEKQHSQSFKQNGQVQLANQFNFFEHQGDQGDQGVHGEKSVFQGLQISTIRQIPDEAQMIDQEFNLYFQKSPVSYRIPCLSRKPYDVLAELLEKNKLLCCHYRKDINMLVGISEGKIKYEFNDKQRISWVQSIKRALTKATMLTMFGLKSFLSVK